MILPLLFGILLSVIFIMKYKHLFIVSAFPSDTIRRVMYSILQQSETISTITSPTTALLQSRECQSALNTLVALTGGTKALSTITGVNTETLQNILYYQEKQISTHMNAGTSSSSTL